MAAPVDAFQNAVGPLYLECIICSGPNHPVDFSHCTSQNHFRKIWEILQQFGSGLPYEQARCLHCFQQPVRLKTNGIHHSLRFNHLDGSIEAYGGTVEPPVGRLFGHEAGTGGTVGAIAGPMMRHDLTEPKLPLPSSQPPPPPSFPPVPPSGPPPRASVPPQYRGNFDTPDAYDPWTQTGSSSATPAAANRCDEDPWSIPSQDPWMGASAQPAHRQPPQPQGPPPQQGQPLPWMASSASAAHQPGPPPPQGSPPCNDPWRQRRDPPGPPPPPEGRPPVGSPPPGAPANWWSALPVKAPPTVPKLQFAPASTAVGYPGVSGHAESTASSTTSSETAQAVPPNHMPGGWNPVATWNLEPSSLDSALEELRAKASEVFSRRRPVKLEVRLTVDDNGPASHASSDTQAPPSRVSPSPPWSSTASHASSPPQPPHRKPPSPRHEPEPTWQPSRIPPSPREEPNSAWDRFSPSAAPQPHPARAVPCPREEPDSAKPWERFTPAAAPQPHHPDPVPVRQVRFTPPSAPQPHHEPDPVPVRQVPRGIASVRPHFGAAAATTVPPAEASASTVPSSPEVPQPPPLPSLKPPSRTAQRAVEVATASAPAPAREFEVSHHQPNNTTSKPCEFSDLRLKQKPCPSPPPEVISTASASASDGNSHQFQRGPTTSTSGPQSDLAAEYEFSSDLALNDEIEALYGDVWLPGKVFQLLPGNMIQVIWDEDEPRTVSNCPRSEVRPI